MKWDTPAAGGDTWSLVNSGGTNLTGAQTITVSGISDAEKLMILIQGASSASAGSEITLRVNTDTATNYEYFGVVSKVGPTYNVNDMLEGGGSLTRDKIQIMNLSNNAGSVGSGYVFFASGCKGTAPKVFTSAGAASAAGSADQKGFWNGGFYVGTSAITSVSAFSVTGNFDAGKMYVYKA